jgi:hypothetical protein
LNKKKQRFLSSQNPTEGKGCQKTEFYQKKLSGPASQGLPQPILRIGVAVFFEEDIEDF